MCCSFRCVGAPLFRFGERVEVLGDRPTPKKSCGFRGCVVECLPKGREDRDLGYHGKVRGSDGTTVYVSCRLRNPMKRFTEYAPHPINLLPLVSRRKAICGSSRKGRRGRNAWDVLSRANGGVQERRGGEGEEEEKGAMREALFSAIRDIDRVSKKQRTCSTKTAAHLSQMVSPPTGTTAPSALPRADPRAPVCSHHVPRDPNLTFLSRCP